MTSVGESLVTLLEAYGVDHVFGIPGVHTVELYRGLAASRIRHVTPRHEQGAGFMADGYARASGKPGVCFVITGPGLTNIATAMAQARADSIPMLVISGVNPAGRMNSGEGWLHELPDQRAFAASIALSSETVLRPADLPGALARAFALFDSARPGPVHIEIPVDVMSQPAVGFAPPVRLSRPEPDSGSLDAAASLLATVRTPVLIAGGGAVRAGEPIRRLAERLDAPVVMTINARGLLPPDHPLGVSASPSLDPVRALLAAADVVLALGTELGPTDFDAYDQGRFALPGTLIRVDLDPAQIARNRPATLGLVGDAGATAAALLDRLSEQASHDGATRAAAARQAARTALDPAIAADVVLLETIRDTLPEALLVGDSTQHVYAGNLDFAAATPGSWFNASVGFGALGYGLPAAIGAALAQPGRPVVCLAGDGGLQFSLAELGTAVEIGVPMILLLLNNGGYGEIRSYMLAKGITPVGVDLHTPDFPVIARAYGWAAERLDDRGELPTLLRQAAASGRPSLIEIVAPRAGGG